GSRRRTHLGGGQDGRDPRRDRRRRLLRDVHVRPEPAGAREAGEGHGRVGAVGLVEPARLHVAAPAGQGPAAELIERGPPAQAAGASLRRTRAATPSPIPRPITAPPAHPIATGPELAGWVTVSTRTSGDGFGWNEDTSTLSPLPAPTPSPTTIAPVM